MKDVEVDLPPGLIGNPAATPTRCTSEQLTELGEGFPSCPVSSQVGVATIVRGFFGTNETFGGIGKPIYNMVPPPGSPAMFGFSGASYPVLLLPRVRSDGDYGFTVKVPGLIQGQGVTGSTVTFWGVPADSSHDAQRGFGVDAGIPTDQGGSFSCADPDFAPPGCVNPVNAPRRPFLTLPTRCDSEPIVTTIRTASWQHPDAVKSASFSQDTNGNPMVITGCENVPFDPQISVQPTSDEPDVATGLDVDLRDPPRRRRCRGVVGGRAEARCRDAPQGHGRLAVLGEWPGGLHLCPDQARVLRSARVSRRLEGSGRSRSSPTC